MVSFVAYLHREALKDRPVLGERDQPVWRSSDGLSEKTET